MEEYIEKILVRIKDLENRVTAIENGGPAMAVAANTDFDDLKNLLELDQWPMAIPPNMICDVSADQDKQDRAEGILDIIIDVHLEGLSFLDFGCGEGHVVNQSLMQNPKTTVGYDIEKSDKWAQWTDKAFFTTNWDEVRERAPYDVVLLYDVVDHMMEENWIEKLHEVKKVMSSNGRAYVRCHPWCSRHGTHLYHQKNKAFMHLVFNDKELEELGFKQTPTRKIIHPLMTYDDLFKKAGFRVVKPAKVSKEKVEGFFYENPLIASRIKKNYISSFDHDLKTGKKFPSLQMEQQFVDIVLG